MILASLSDEVFIANRNISFGLYGDDLWPPASFNIVGNPLTDLSND